MEKVIYDSGVIRVMIRPVRDNSAEIDPSLPWWQKQYYTEPYRVAQGIASVRDASADGLQQEHELNFWLARVNTCMYQGLALASFVGSKQGDNWVYGAPASALLALPDTMDSSRAVLFHLGGNAFAENTASEMLKIAREHFAAQGRKLMEKRVKVEWIEV